jgi:hypothetical protein
LVNDQRDAQLFSMHLFLFLTLYMFRAHRAHHQERQILSTQPLVTVTLCRWAWRVQVERVKNKNKHITIYQETRRDGNKFRFQECR